MIENHPKDSAGKLAFFPGAPCAQPAEHIPRQLAHLVDFARLDCGYARGRAVDLARDNPLWFAHLPAALDVELERAEIPLCDPYEELPPKLPRLAKGPRGLPKHRFFHDTL